MQALANAADKSQSGDPAIQTCKFGTVRKVLLVLLVSMLTNTSALADWRGLFDDYGKTFEECLTVQENKLLKDVSIPTRGRNSASSRASDICRNIWVEAPKEYSKDDHAKYGCRFKWGKAKWGESPKIEPDNASGLDPKIWETYVPVLIRGVENTQVVILTCNEGNPDRPPGRVTAAFWMGGADAPMIVTAEFNSHGTAYLNAEQPLHDHDQPELLITQFLVITNHGEYVRK